MQISTATPPTASNVENLEAPFLGKLTLALFIGALFLFMLDWMSTNIILTYGYGVEANPVARGAINTLGQDWGLLTMLVLSTAWYGAWTYVLGHVNMLLAPLPSIIAYIERVPVLIDNLNLLPW